MNWAYVGHGNGTFQQVTSYSFVGQGRGSYEREEVVTPGRWNVLKVCMCLGCTLAVFVFLALLMHLTTALIRSGFLNFGNGAGAQPDVQGMVYDCDNGYDNWAAGWDDAKKRWCCKTQHRGCEPELNGCETNCNFKRLDASCRLRIQWGANHHFLHQPNACAESYQMVLGQCPYCAGCELAAAGCQAAPPVFRALAVR